MATVSRGTTSERFGFIARNRQLGVQYLCDWLNVSPSGFYAWDKRKPSKRKKEDQRLLKMIKDIHKETREVYGSPRMYKALKEKGIRIGKKRVERLMRTHGIVGRVVKVTRRQPGLKKFLGSGENLRRKAPKVTGTNQQWVADVTYLKADNRWFYLAVIMDIYSRRILGWTLGKNRTVKLTLTALRYALKARKPKNGLIFHTDRGIEFTNFKFRNVLKAREILPSVNRPGCCTDNAHMESFFHSLKAELIRGTKFNSELELRLSLNSYINQFYNHKRLHSGIDYQSPAVFEQLQS